MRRDWEGRTCRNSYILGTAYHDIVGLQYACSPGGGALEVAEAPARVMYTCRELLAGMNMLNASR